MSHIYRYSIIRFRPSADTGEFANIGIVVLDLDAQRIAYKLAPKRFTRINGFFDKEAYKAYQAITANLHDELGRFAGLIATGWDLAATEIFAELIAPRESSILFSAPRIMQADDWVEDVTTRLFDRLVKREQTTPTHPEQQLTQGIRNALHRNGLRQFKNLAVDDDVIPVRFPLGIQRSTIRAIQPLAFSQKTPMAVFDHGAQWRQRLAYLLDKGKILPHHILMAIEAPDADGDPAIQDAYHATRADLAKLPLPIVEATPDGTINPAVIAFARQAMSSYPLLAH